MSRNVVRVTWVLFSVILLFTFYGCSSALTTDRSMGLVSQSVSQSEGSISVSSQSEKSEDNEDDQGVTLLTDYDEPAIISETSDNATWVFKIPIAGEKPPADSERAYIEITLPKGIVMAEQSIYDDDGIKLGSVSYYSAIGQGGLKEGLGQVYPYQTVLLEGDYTQNDGRSVVYRRTNYINHDGLDLYEYIYSMEIKPGYVVTVVFWGIDNQPEQEVIVLYEEILSTITPYTS